MSPEPLVWRIVFSDEAFDDDLQHLTPWGRRTMQAARAELEANGLPHDWLRATANEHEGTDLTGRVKVRLPNPTDGRWGAVLRGAMITRNPTLIVVAVGERHPTEPWRPSVYQIAHGRVHG